MNLESKTILLVEDDETIAQMEMRWLKKEGFNVIHSFCGMDAVYIARNKPELIDLILMDIDLGAGMDGLETAREILKYNDIPLLFLSTHTEKEFIDKAKAITSYGYVVKSWDPVKLFASIRIALSLSAEKRKAV